MTLTNYYQLPASPEVFYAVCWDAGVWKTMFYEFGVEFPENNDSFYCFPMAFPVYEADAIVTSFTDAEIHPDAIRTLGLVLYNELRFRR